MDENESHAGGGGQIVKVCIGSAGRFHTFDLARQMERLGYLGQLYTGYPKYKVDALPPEKVQTFPWAIVPTILLGRCGLHGLQKRANVLAIRSFDRSMAARLERCDIFHCLSSFGLRTHRVAKERYGAITICDRASSHILYADEILREEYASWALPYRPIDRILVERELQEYETCDLILLPSSFAYRSFLQNGVPESKLIKIPFGVDLSLFRPVVKEDDVFRVIYVGALSLQKGIPYLLEAIARLRLPKFELWLIGSSLPETRQFLVNFEGSYRYFGVLPRRELYKFYSQSSVLVLASIQEGFGLVQAQAMACGLPVIATAHTGAEDLFTDGVEGFIVPIRSPEAIREKVLYLYQNPERRETMAKAALQRVQLLGGWDSYGNQIARCYESALEHQVGAVHANPSG